MIHMEISKVPRSRNSLHITPLFYGHSRKFPETKHLDLYGSGGSGGVGSGKVGLQTANLNSEFLRID